MSFWKQGFGHLNHFHWNSAWKHIKNVVLLVLSKIKLKKQQQKWKYGSNFCFYMTTSPLVLMFRSWNSFIRLHLSQKCIRLVSLSRFDQSDSKHHRFYCLISLSVCRETKQDSLFFFQGLKERHKHIPPILRLSNHQQHVAHVCPLSPV